MGGVLQPDPVSSRASAEAAESTSRVSRDPFLWTGGDVVGSPFPPHPVPPASPWASTHQHHGAPKFCFGDSWGSQHPSVAYPSCPLSCLAQHCGVPWSPEPPGQLILHPAPLLISCLYFLGSCQCPRSLNSHVCPGHSRLSVKAPSQAEALDVSGILPGPSG